jgi:type VI secretion system VasD/TssJ family lipoprotein
VASKAETTGALQTHKLIGVKLRRYRKFAYRLVNPQEKFLMFYPKPELTLVKFLLCMCAILLFSACAAPVELTVADDAWTFEKNAIIVKIQAPADLNARNGRPHALSLGIFQLNDPNVFAGLSATHQGSLELLSKGKIDDTVVDFQRVTVQPGERRDMTLSRAKEAQHIGFIVGYYKFNPKQDVYLFPIPIEESKRGIVEKVLSSLGLISNASGAHPVKLNIRFDLGRLGTNQAIIIKPIK